MDYTSILYEHLTLKRGKKSRKVLYVSPCLDDTRDMENTNSLWLCVQSDGSIIVELDADYRNPGMTYTRIGTFASWLDYMANGPIARSWPVFVQAD